MSGVDVMTKQRRVREVLYRRWMVACLPTALIVGAVLVSTGSSMSLAMVSIWGQFIVYLVHEFEEHVYPGRFKEYFNTAVAGSLLRKKYKHQTLPSGDFPLDDRAVFWINISFIWIAFPLCAVAAGRIDIRFGLFLPCVAIVNGVLHLIVALATRGYNPGLITGVLVNIPTGLLTINVLLDAGATSQDVMIALVLAVVGHLLIIAWTIAHVRRVAVRFG